MMERYRNMIESAGGRVHREEDWGRRQLAHSIAKVHKAHYLLLNIECGKPALDELVGAFRFNDAVLRYLVIHRDKAITEPSVMAKAQEEERAREAQAGRDGRPRSERSAAVAKDADTERESPAQAADADDGGAAEAPEAEEERTA
jgi:small subunit ribosomal protein S6